MFLADIAVYKQRRRIKRFNRLKHFRSFSKRQNRRVMHFTAFIALTAAKIWRG